MATEKREAWEWIKALAIAVILAGVIRFYLFAPIVVDGESMMPTLKDQDRMIVNKASYLVGEPDRFDIVVFKATEEKDYIKRVIGLPGDHVAYRDDTLFINGEPLEEPFLKDFKRRTDEGNLTFDFTLEEILQEGKVPEGQLFVMGDNRRYSKDSRIIGTIPMDRVIGEANVIYWPPSHMEFFD